VLAAKSGSKVIAMSGLNLRIILTILFFVGKLACTSPRLYPSTLDSIPKIEDILAICFIAALSYSHNITACTLAPALACLASVPPMSVTPSGSVKSTKMLAAFCSFLACSNLDPLKFNIINPDVLICLEL